MTTQTPTTQQLRTWINRQRTLGTPSPKYLAWLKSQYKLSCEAEVIKQYPNSLVNSQQKEKQL